MKPTKTSLALLLAALVLPAAHAAPALSLTPSSGSLMPGDTFSVALAGSDFDDTAVGTAIDNVSGGQGLQLSFSAGVLELLSVTIDPRWTFGAANKPGTIDNVAGTLTGLGFGSFPATTDDSFAIATLQFRALAAGLGTLAVGGAQMVGRVGGVGASTIASELPTAQFTVSAVPEPASWALMGGALALAGMVRLARRAPALPR